jgi:hypothetical protein
VVAQGTRSERLNVHDSECFISIVDCISTKWSPLIPSITSVFRLSVALLPMRLAASPADWQTETILKCLSFFKKVCQTAECQSISATTRTLAELVRSTRSYTRELLRVDLKVKMMTLTQGSPLAHSLTSAPGIYEAVQSNAAMIHAPLIANLVELQQVRISE